MLLVDWLPAAPPLLVFALLLYVPGAVVLWGAGLRPGLALGLAPLTSTAVAGIGAVVLAALGIPWSVAAFLVAALGAAVIAASARLVVQRGRFRMPRLTRPRWTPASWWIAAGAGVNALVVLWIYVRPTASAEAVPLEYDTVWHFAVMRWMTQTGDASSLDVGLLDGTTGNHFYPSAWHSLVVLAQEATGASPQAAVHGSILALLLVTWPVGIAWLAKRLFGSSPSVSSFAFAFASLPAVFPIGFLTFGLLYSNLFSYALAPLALIVGIEVLRRIARRDVVRALPWVGAAVAAASIPVAFLFAQPNSAFTLLVILLPLVVVAVWGLFAPAEANPRRWWPRALALAVFGVALVVGWIVVHDSSFLARTVTVTTWNAYQTKSQAIGEYVFFGQGTDGQLALGLLTLGGIVLLFVRRTQRWLAVSWALLGALFVVSSALSGSTGSLRNYLVGFWYADSTRLAAAAALVAVPLMAVAADALARWLVTRTPARLRARTWMLPMVAALLAVAVIAFTLAETSMRMRTADVREKSSVGDAQWLSPAEETFLTKVRDLIGPDAVVANNPFDGSAMGYSLNGIHMLFPALPGNWMGATTAAQTTIIDSLERAASDPAVCDAIRTLHVSYAIVLRQGERRVFGNDPSYFAGLKITDQTPGFTPVLSDGPLVLYRVDGCAAAASG